MKTLSILLYIVAGFFCYMVTLLAFANVAPSAKYGIMAVFVVPGVIAHCVGLSINNFGSWQRTTGVVLLSGAVLTAFVGFSFVCLLKTDEFRRMLKPETLAFASDYVTGIIFLLITTIAGLSLLRGKNLRR